MDWWWWALIFGGPLAGIATGFRDSVSAALGKRHKRKLELIEAKREDRAALEAAGKPPEPVCGCGHHLAKHDKQGKCHETVQVPVAWDADKKPVGYERGRCNCQQYVGPQPLATIYAEELTELG
ncbi:hypothetical protein I5Q34_13240 [Streptomyces sp. AV19]|uniref:hypothetical protein n=1 Tax=Streptomyces sp. AV19 TaxID=2793068 RepID=UPI0018FEDA37|nr:hypothetical protein [Streptomyces sp. AV19]MBH1935228.1 hypothetical protein [Streptomyces sp. AV19]MDG4531129.1 hypothetical protein [Streptomyces sp. AV19]